MNRLVTGSLTLVVTIASLATTAHAQHRVRANAGDLIFLMPLSDTSLCITKDRVMTCSESSQISLVRESRQAKNQYRIHFDDKCLYSNKDGRFGVGNCSKKWGDQLWKFEALSAEGTYTIRNENSNKCLTWGGRKRPAQLIAKPCSSNTSNQQWQTFKRPAFNERKPFQLSSAAISKCLDFDEKSKRMVQRPCSESANHFVSKNPYSPVNSYIIKHIASDRCLSYFGESAGYGDCTIGKTSGFRMFPGKGSSVMLKSYDLKRCLQAKEDGGVYNSNHCAADERGNLIRIKPFHDSGNVKARAEAPLRNEKINLATRGATRGKCLNMKKIRFPKGIVGRAIVDPCTFESRLEVIQSPMSGVANIIQLKHVELKKCLSLSKKGKPIGHGCDAEKKEQAWIVTPIEGKSGFLLKNLEKNTCMVMTNDGYSLAECDASKRTQVWSVMEQM